MKAATRAALIRAFKEEGDFLEDVKDPGSSYDQTAPEEQEAWSEYQDLQKPQSQSEYLASYDYDYDVYLEDHGLLPSKTFPCSACKGNGHNEWEHCQACDGRGRVPREDCVVCPSCDGERTDETLPMEHWQWRRLCEVCNGEGWVLPVLSFPDLSDV